MFDLLFDNTDIWMDWYFDQRFPSAAASHIYWAALQDRLSEVLDNTGITEDDLADELDRRLEAKLEAKNGR